MRRRQLRSHAMRHGCGNLSQDRVFVLCGSTESEALSVAFAIHLDDRGVMDQSIDGRRRHGGIGKDRVPGRNDWLAVIAMLCRSYRCAMSSNRTLVSAWSLRTYEMSSSTMRSYLSNFSRALTKERSRRAICSRWTISMV